MTDYFTTKTTWWIAHNNNDVVHFDMAREGLVVSTGQPFFETFDNKFDWEKRITELQNQPIEIEDEDIDLSIDDKLYCDSVEHLLYDDKNFRHISPPLRLDT